MVGVLRDIWIGFWRLLPANPIVVRVVTAGGKRARHFYVRVAYLAILIVVVFVLGNNLMQASQASLAALAKQSTQTFMWVSVVQLFMMSFMAPVFTAAAITQEKDANTFHILLTTPLSAAQIVLGSLFSRLYFVWVLLLAGLPVFCITMLYGGVTAREVFESFGLAATTGLVTGSLAIMISMTRIGTRRTIFSFFVGVAVYLLALGALGLSPYGALSEAPVGAVLGNPTRMSWLAPIHPFLALFVVTGQTTAPPMSDVIHYGRLRGWMLAYPQYAYIAITTLASTLMILFSLFFVRRSAKEGELTWWTRLRGGAKAGSPAGERKRKPRNVWNNPIAWREAATRASAGGRSMLRWVFAVLCVLLSIWLLVAHESGWLGMGPSGAGVKVTRNWLTATIWIELAVILLVVTNTAATTLTREKESQTMELLLTTPLTSKYIVAGMLRGLVSFAMPLILAPALVLLLFVASDLLHGRGNWVTTPETVLVTPLLLTVFAALAAMTGMHFSLQFKKTVQAVLVSTGVVMGAVGMLWVCGFAFGRGAAGLVSSAILPLLPFPAIQTLIDYESVYKLAASAPAVTELLSARIIRLVSCLMSIGAYSGLTFLFYNTIVRNFDMTIRRQSS